MCVLFWLKSIVCEYQYPQNCGADFGAVRSMKAEAIAIKLSVFRFIFGINIKLCCMCSPVSTSSWSSTMMTTTTHHQLYIQ